MKHILRWFMRCILLLMLCFSVASAEGDFYLVFPCESGTVIAVTVSQEHGYIAARVHAQYPLERLPGFEGEVTVKEIDINGKLYPLEEADVDRYASGSRADYRYRITDFSGETMNSVKLTIAERFADGERLYALDLPCGQAKWMFTPAIVRALVDGNIYTAPSASGAAIGHLHDGAKLMIYFATGDGWAAIGAGSRDAELWGYMRIQELYLGEEEIHRLTSDIEQWDAQESYAVYGDAGCTQALHEVEKGDSISILGCVGDVSFIQTGAQYGYVPTELLYGHSCRASTSDALVYKADVRVIMMRSSLDTASLRRYPCRLNVRNGFCRNRFRKSRRALTSSSEIKASSFPSSSWNAQRNRLKHDSRNYAPMSARMMWSHLSSLVWIGSSWTRRMRIKICSSTQKCAMSPVFPRRMRRNPATCL